jgi:alpha-L-arabinofuranosidase
MTTLYQVEDDAALADGEIARLLREAGCPLLRFPGGGVADNWNWKTQTLDRPDRWPFRAGPDTTDTDEFMKFCRAVGAEPIFVCNFAKTISGPGIDEAVRNAVEWLTYCNKTKDYGVKYWEIGNETYLGGEYSCTVASEYADGLIRFSRAMKAVDSTIEIGANGPHPAAAPGKLDTVPWWPTVLEKAIDDIDFIILHTYLRAPDYEAYLYGDKHFAYDALTVREYIGKHYPERADMAIALTEWNVNRRSNLDNSLGHAIVVANALAEFTRGGISIWAASA